MKDLKNSDFDSLLPPFRLSRRGFLAASLAGGFAAAAGPVQASTVIQTSAEGLVAGDITYQVGDDTIPAYRAMPEGKSKVPVVLVVQEIFGVHEYIKDVCRRLAKQGYMAIAPELYIRQGNPATYSDVGPLIAELVSKVPDAQVMNDLDAAVAWAGNNGGDAARLGITGFCWGGRITWLYAARNPKVKAGVAWYGRLTGEADELRPSHPLDIAGLLHCPVLGLYGGKDSGIPLAAVEQMKKALAEGNAASRASEFVVYPEAPHAFHADYRPSYRADAANDGWNRMLAWFGRYL